MSKVFASSLDECALPGSPATFSMHDSVARRKRTIFFGGRVALRALWVLWATERQCALGSGGFRSHGGEDRQVDEAGEASWSRHRGTGVVEQGFGVEQAGRHRSAHEPEAWPAGWSSPGRFHHSLGRSQSAPPPLAHAASISYR